MRRLVRCLPLALLLAACGGDARESRAEGGSGGGSSNDEDFDPCALVTSEEIQATLGWAPDTSSAKDYGSTKTCLYNGPDVMKQSLVLVIARPAPNVSSSAELVERRTKAAQSDPSIKMVFTPIEDLGRPAVRSEVEGAPAPTVEVVVGRHLLGVTTSDFETAKAIAAKAADRLP